MRLTAKTHKLQKTKKHFQKTSIFFVFNASNIDSKGWVKTEQTFFNYKLKYYRLYNSLAKRFLRNSIYKNVTVLINSFLCIVFFSKNKNIDLDFPKMIKLNPSISFLGLKLNNKFYSASQLNKVSTLNYKQNIKTFNKSLRKTLELPYKKLSSLKSK